MNEFFYYLFSSSFYFFLLSNPAKQIWTVSEKEKNKKKQLQQLIALDIDSVDFLLT
jgi:hypothetical protein